MECMGIALPITCVALVKGLPRILMVPFAKLVAIMKATEWQVWRCEEHVTVIGRIRRRDGGSCERRGGRVHRILKCACLGSVWREEGVASALPDLPSREARGVSRCERAERECEESECSTGAWVGGAQQPIDGGGARHRSDRDVGIRPERRCRCRPGSTWTSWGDEKGCWEMLLRLS